VVHSDPGARNASDRERDVPNVVESLEIAATNQTPLHSGAIAVGTFPTSSNPLGETQALESP